MNHDLNNMIFDKLVLAYGWGQTLRAQFQTNENNGNVAWQSLEEKNFKTTYFPSSVLVQIFKYVI